MVIWLKFAHVTTVALSGAFLAARGVAMTRQAAWLRRRPARILPHIIDPLLLLTGIGLMVTTAQYPSGFNWLTAKLTLVVVYIGLGMVALRRGRTRRLRILALIAALGVFAWIVGIAVGHRPPAL